MRAPLSWIRDFTPIEAEPDVVGDRARQPRARGRGDRGAGCRDRWCRRRADRRSAPASQRRQLQLADVDTGDGVVRVVCGAPNIHAGMVVPLATVGGRLPGGVEIGKSKIRGETSLGMLCSTRELGLGDDHSGILAIDAEAELGTDVREVLGLDDVVFHLSLTPNRPDAMGIVGIARELAAHFGLPFDGSRTPPTPRWSTERSAARPRSSKRPTGARDSWSASRTVTMGESPDWMQRRLRLAGMRADQQRRRRHQLRDARTVPSAARVRSRPPGRSRASSCGSRSRARR